MVIFGWKRKTPLKKEEIPKRMRGMKSSFHFRMRAGKTTVIVAKTRRKKHRKRSVPWVHEHFEHFCNVLRKIPPCGNLLVVFATRYLFSGESRNKLTSGVHRAGALSGRLLTVAVLCLLPFIISCGKLQNRRDLAVRLAVDEDRGDDDARIAELKADIRGVEKQVEKTIEAVRDKGTYWRLLAMKYMDYQMWGEAIAAFDEAVALYPEHASLIYNRALTAGQMALSSDTPGMRASYLARSEYGYRRALTLDPRYTPAMYALAALLVFELDRSFEAGPLLEEFLKIERSDVNARLLLARVYLEAGMIGDALDLYDEITRLAKDQSDVIKAEDLYNRVAGGDYGS